MEGKAGKKELIYKIIHAIGIISRSPKGWTKELNIVQWGDNPAKYDIRDWAPDHSAMSKGITLTETEIFALKELLNEKYE